MNSEFQRLRLNDLSTVHELDEQRTITSNDRGRDRDRMGDQHTLTKANVGLLSKQRMLQQYVESDDFNDFENEYDEYDEEGDGIGQRVREKIRQQQQQQQQHQQQQQEQSQHHHQNTPKHHRPLKSAMKTPVSGNMLKMTNAHHGTASGTTSTESSRTPSSVQSQYSESDTENSDYANDYDGFEDGEYVGDGDLIKKFQQRQMEARMRVEGARLKNERLMKYHKRNNSTRSVHKYDNDNIDRWEGEDDDDDGDFDSDFDDVQTIDPRRLNRFANSTSALPNIQKKKSMPAMTMTMGTSLKGSPKKVKKSVSSMDMKHASQLRRRGYLPSQNYRHMEYPVYDGDELDDIQDFDLTVSLSDYHKLKKKSQKMDLSKYAETPSSHSRHTRKNSQFNVPNPVFFTPQTSRTSQLTREGKIRLIRSLGKPKVRKVMPGHLYGEIIYEPNLKKWCGNEEDLVRFESINTPMAKPKLITRSESTPQVVGNMVYDDKKLRWVSLTGSYEDDPFDDEFDTTIMHDPETRAVTGSKSMERKTSTITKQENGAAGFRGPSFQGRGVSGRLVPSESTMSLADHTSKDRYSYKVSAGMYKAWKNEEDRWIRKVGNWFPDTEDCHEFKYELKVFLNNQ